MSLGKKEINKTKKQQQQKKKKKKKKKTEMGIFYHHENMPIYVDPFKSILRWF